MFPSFILPLRNLLRVNILYTVMPCLSRSLCSLVLSFWSIVTRMGRLCAFL